MTVVFINRGWLWHSVNICVTGSFITNGSVFLWFGVLRFVFVVFICAWLAWFWFVARRTLCAFCAFCVACGDGAVFVKKSNQTSYSPTFFYLLPILLIYRVQFILALLRARRHSVPSSDSSGFVLFRFALLAPRVGSPPLFTPPPLPPTTLTLHTTYLPLLPMLHCTPATACAMLSPPVLFFSARPICIHACLPRSCGRVV